MVMPRLVATIFWLLRLVPSGLAYRFSQVFAQIYIWMDLTHAHVARVNIEACFPELSDEERKRMIKQVLTYNVLFLFEFAYLLHRPVDQLFGKVIDVEGEDMLHDAWESKRGVLLLVPHFGFWEILSLFLGARYPMSALYSPPNVAALEPAILRARQRQGAQMHPTTAAGLRKLIKGLKDGRLVVVLPDQVPRGKKSQCTAPFYGQPAVTMLLAKRLQQVGSPVVLMAAAYRTREGSAVRYKICFERPAAGVESAEDVIHATALNKSIEKLVARDPEQYQWSYKRLRRTDEHGKDVYRRQ